MITISTIKYKIKEDSFEYHMLKGKIIKGTTISKKEHPIREVNNFRDKLISEGKLVDKKNYYIVKQPIKTGMLMAYNLHHGILKKRLDKEHSIYIGKDIDKKVKESFDFKNIYSTDDKFIIGLKKDEIKLIGVYKYKLSRDFFIGTSPDDFSGTEKFVSEILKENNIINNYRHGSSSKQEADIVIEEEKRQIEILFEYKNKISTKSRSKMDQDALIISELIDTNLIQPSNSILKKIYQKEYTNLYEKELAILCFGSFKSIKTMAEKLVQQIKTKGTPKNDFKKVYIICDDIVDNVIYICNGENWKKQDAKKYNKSIFQKEKIKCSEIEDDESYYYEAVNIFNNEKEIGILDGKTMKSLFSSIKVINDEN